MKLEYHERQVSVLDIHSIFASVGIAPEDLPIYCIQNYQRAFYHKSYCYPNNERDEFLGDSIIALITNLYLFDRFDDQNEGFLTKLKTKIVNGKTLADLSVKLSLQHHILVSKHVAENNNERTIQGILEDTLEAFVAAIFRDQRDGTGNDGVAFYKTQYFFVTLLEQYIDFSQLVLVETNYKDVLLKYFQKMFKLSPIYKDITPSSSSSSLSSSMYFEVAVCHMNGNEIARGSGSSKREAQQNAAKHTLEFVKSSSLINTIPMKNIHGLN